MIDVILCAGRSALEVALYTLLPIMVLLTIIMRLLEAYGVLDKLVLWLTPIARPFGLPGLGALALLQGSLISFIAPLPTMKAMEARGVSTRGLGATLAGVLAIAPANATFPLASYGLHVGFTLLESTIGGLTAATVTYWIFGRRLSALREEPLEVEARSGERQPLLMIINTAGAEAIQSILGIIPMLLVSLVIVMGLQASGAIGWLVTALSPLLTVIGVDPVYILPTITKFLAGNTAFVGLIHETAKQPGFVPEHFWKGAGFLLHPLDLTGVAILTAGGPRIMSTIAPALAGAVVGIVVRGMITAFCG